MRAMMRSGESSAFSLASSSGARGVERLVAGKDMGDADRVEKVARRVGREVVAQVDRQAHGDGAAALERGGLLPDGEHLRRGQVTCQRDAERARFGQHIFDRQVALKELGLVQRQPPPVQAADRAARGGVGRGESGLAAGVELLEAVLGHIGSRSALVPRDAFELVRVAQCKVVVHKNLQKQQPAVAVRKGVEHLDIDARAVVADAVEQLVFDVPAIDGRAGRRVFGFGARAFAAGFKIMPEQPAVQRDLEVGQVARRALQRRGQRVGVDVLGQRAADAEHARVPPGNGGQEHLGHIIHLVPGIRHGGTSFFERQAFRNAA